MADEDAPKEQKGPKGFQMVGEAEPTAGVPPITFGAFVLSLSTSALVHLGAGADPEGGEASPPNLPLARQTIEILEMLAQKTEGNLDDDEGRLLEAILHDLRMRYVQVSREKG
jgi:hypothetical protein